ncbi:MAG: hypothetical protein A3E82_07535 [Gammaproteobacteria bacterium RIFCSPHIGHO2_12_FULL_38_11]|nr:MAG: hypothetical protein A3E82_07535 [Gammaproteobacteria bacterium RIFCSPHIGHO2_12_FULL_38_11]
MTICLVIVSEKAQRNLRKVSQHIIRKFQSWTKEVEARGILKVRKIKSYHDKPLQGTRFGQRSIRLNRSYRAFYVVKNDEQIEFIEVQGTGTK